MTPSLKTMILTAGAGLLLAAAPRANAQVATSFIVIDPIKAVTGTQAFQTATREINATYAAQIAQAKAEKAQYDPQNAANIAAYQDMVKTLGADNPGTLAKGKAAMAYEQKTEADLERIQAPIRVAVAYVTEQIRAHLEEAARTVMTNRHAMAVLPPASAPMVAPGVDATPDATHLLDTLVPHVSSTPPAGWHPQQ